MLKIVAGVLAVLAVLTRASKRRAKRVRARRKWSRAESRAAWRIARARGDRRTVRPSWAAPS